MGIKVHLHLPQLMITDYDNGIMTKGIGFHQLTNPLIVGSHTTSDERLGTRGDVVATLESSITLYSQNRFQSEVLIAQVNNIGLWGSLTGVHTTNDMTSRCGNAL